MYLLSVRTLGAFKEFHSLIETENLDLEYERFCYIEGVLTLNRKEKKGSKATI